MEEAFGLMDYNKDGRIDFDDILDVILDLMKKKRKEKLTGPQKKQLVFQELEIMFGSEILANFKPILNQFVDFCYKKFIKKCSKICC